MAEIREGVGCPFTPTTSPDRTPSLTSCRATFSDALSSAPKETVSSAVKRAGASLQAAAVRERKGTVFA
jgi:hypothetical protein